MTSPTQRQMEHISAARELFKPSPVRLHHVPDWLRRRMLKAFGSAHRDTSGWGVLNHALRGGQDFWLDHWGTTTLPNGHRAFVSEPYGFTPEMARGLQEFCKPMGVSYYVSANSWWYPGWTVRIVIEEPEPQATTLRGAEEQLLDQLEVDKALSSEAGATFA